jgi:transposase-like protein
LVTKSEQNLEDSRATEGARRATGVAREAAERNGEAPDPEVVDKATRRRFTAAYKRRIVREADKCTKPGELGALLRREGVYSSSLSTWRRQLNAGELAGTGAKRGPKVQPKDPRDKRIAELERETRRLGRKLEQAETVIGIQKKVASLLGIPLRNPDDEENS